MKITRITRHHALDFLAIRYAGTKNEEHASRSVLEFTQCLSLNDDVQSAVDAYIASLQRRKLSGPTQNRRRAYCMVFLKYLHTRGWIEKIPEWPIRPESPNRERVLTAQELDDVCARMSRTHAAFTRFLANTGFRLSEGLTCQFHWDKLGPGSHVAFVSDSKSGKSRVVPLNAAAFAALDGRSDAFRTVVKRTFQRVFAEACAACGIHDAVVHSLRHTFASNLVAKGAPLPVVQRLLGHASLSMTMRYAHANDQQALEAVEKLK